MDGSHRGDVDVTGHERHLRWVVLSVLGAYGAKVLLEHQRSTFAEGKQTSEKSEVVPAPLGKE